MTNLPERFQAAYASVESLQNHERYLGAFIFGSVARGDASEHSDFDVKVVVDTDNPCTNINHPVTNGVKLDVTFLSMAQLSAFTEQEIKKGERIPMIAESIIVFDKNGDLATLKQQAQTAQPKKATPNDYQHLQFMAYHVDNKVTRLLADNPAAALLSMGMGIGELVKIHYHIRGRWQVSDKRLLRDLEQWDTPFAALLSDFARSTSTNVKYHLWGLLVDYVLAPIGGRQPIAENNCDCEICAQDLVHFTD